MLTSSADVCTPDNALEQRQHVADSWVRPLIALALAALITVFLLRSTALSMLKIWYSSSTYSYGFIVVPIFCFLVWRKRLQLKALSPATSFVGLALFLACALVWTLGNIADVQVIQQFAFIGMLDALIWTFLGSSVVRLLRFPLLFLLFVVPAGQELVEPLQRLTAAFAVNAVRLSGIPAVQNGFIISTPSGDWRIAEACSGIRYLTSTLLIGVLFAGIAFRSWKRRIAFIGLSAVVPILANALRAYLIIVLAYFSNNRIASGVDHVMYGWLFFSLVTALMIGLALSWRETPIPAEIAKAGSSPPAAAESVMRLSGFVGAALLVVLAASSTADYLWSRTAPNQPIDKLWSAPSAWIGSDEPDHDWAPQFENVESETSQRFTDGSNEIFIYAVSYPSKRQGVELVHSANAVPFSGDWEIMDTNYRQVNIAGRKRDVAEFLLARTGERRLVWMWYLSGGEITSKPYEVKLIEAKSRIMGKPQNVTLFAASAVFRTKVVDALDNLRDFMQNVSFSEWNNEKR